MPANTYVPLLTSAAILLGSCGLMTQSAHAETIETDEYIYIGVEAEAFDTGEERWVVTDSATPAIAEDPDGNHSDTSSGGVYLELLPDIRVTHEDAFSPPTAFWGQAGQGPKASYTVTFPEAGRYYVHGRAYSTGTEDNGLHIGLNNDWPLSGRAMQFCTASAKAWTWRSSQRDAGGNGSCGIEKTIYLDIPTAGDHTITISAREDGFELDRFAMIKGKSGNTRICSPLNVNEVTCKNGSIESADGFVDLRLLSTPDTTQASVGDSVNFTATLENLDAFDTATDIEISVSAGAGATLSTADSKCSSTGSNLVCTVAQQAPTASNVNESFEFSMVVSEAGEYVVEASATATETDELPDNNTVSQSLVFDAADTSTELGVEISATATTLNVNDSTVLTVVVNNTGSFTNIMAKELTTKKERKAFEIGKQFNKLGHFDYTFLTPAIAAFDNFISDYPGSIYREEALYLKFESATEFGLNSFTRLKQERMENAKTAYNALKKQFPETKYAEDAAKLLEKLEKDLDRTNINKVKETK